VLPLQFPWVTVTYLVAHSAPVGHSVNSQAQAVSKINVAQAVHLAPPETILFVEDELLIRMETAEFYVNPVIGSAKRLVR